MFVRKLIYFTVFIVIGMFNNLHAGPVRASKWQRDGQVVLLYGDFHNTHTTMAAQEAQAIAAFSRELHSVNTETLLLSEGRYDPTYYTVISELDFKSLMPDWDARFMHALAHADYSMHNRYIENRGIDTRSELAEIFRMALSYSNQEWVLKNLTNEEQAIYQKAYEAIKDRPIVDVFSRPIENAKLWAANASSEQVENIFNDIASVIEARKGMLWKIILEETRLSSDELNVVTLAVISQIKNRDIRYRQLFAILSRTLAYASLYSSGIVEAEALQYITTAENQSKKIVVIAGGAHIRRLEDYLMLIGFEQSKKAASDHGRACNEVAEAQRKYWSVIAPEYASRLAPLPITDPFGMTLIGASLLGAERRFKSTPEAQRSKDQVDAVNNLETKKAVCLSKSPSLISSDTFTWIHENNI